MHVISGLHVGGAEMMLYRLLANSQSQDAVVVSFTSQGELATKIRQLGIEVIELNRGSLIATCRQLLSLIDQHKPQLIQSWLYRADLIAGIAARIKRTPVAWNVRQTQVGVVQGQRHIWLTQRLNALLSWFLPTKIVYCAEAARLSHEAIGYAKQKSVVINNGIDTEKYALHENLRRKQRQDWEVFNNDVVIGMVGRFDPLKNHQRFVCIVNKVIKACPQHNIKAVLVGRGINKSNLTLMRTINALGLREKFLLIDETEDMVSAYSAMDIHLLTSDNEGWPNALGEALSMGLPCVSTDVGDVGVMMYDKSAVIDVNDESAFVQSVVNYVNLSSGERWKLAKMNRGFVQKNSSLESTVNGYDALYLSLV